MATQANSKVRSLTQANGNAIDIPVASLEGAFVETITQADGQDASKQTFHRSVIHFADGRVVTVKETAAVINGGKDEE